MEFEEIHPVSMIELTARKTTKSMYEAGLYDIIYN